MANTNDPQLELKNAVDSFTKDKDALLSKYKLKEQIQIDFPMYRELPIEIQLALQVIEKAGGTFITIYNFTEEPKK